MMKNYHHAESMRVGPVHLRQHPIWITVGLLLLFTSGAAVGQPRPDWAFPGADWETRTVEQMGLDRTNLDQLKVNLMQNSTTSKSGGVVIKNGYLVYSWGNYTGIHNWASASKPVVSTLLLSAVDEGRIDSVDSLIADWGWSLRTEDRVMTFRQLADMTSGYAVAEAPGQRWAYNDYAIMLYIKTLDRVFGTSNHLVTAGTQRISGPLQFEDGGLFESSKGRVRSSARDLARVGWMWANKGAWDTRRIIPENLFTKYVKADVPATTPRTITSNSSPDDYLGVGTYGGGVNQTSRGPGYYGFNWWFNKRMDGAQLAWPTAPADTYQANGRWGKEAVTVIPSLGMVVAAWNDNYAAWGDERSLSPGDPSSRMNLNLKLIVESASNVTDLTWQAGEGDWHETGNWDPGGGLAGLPNELRRVRIDNGGIAEIAFSQAQAKALYVGDLGAGTVAMSGGSLTAENVVIGYQGQGTFLQSGGDITILQGLYLGLGDLGAGTLSISGGSMVSVAGTLSIDSEADGDSFINMYSGGMLALYGDADDSLAEFLNLIEGAGAIRYWDNSASGWTDITTATLNDDYTLSYQTTGDLAGFTVLTVNSTMGGDVNGDGAVDVIDLGTFSTNYGVLSGAEWSDGDFTGDGAVDVVDLGILATNYGNSLSSAVSVPEPGVITLLPVGMMSLIFGIRRK